MSTPKIIEVDSLGEASCNSPMKGQISRFYNGEAVARQDRTKDLSHLESIQDLES